MTTLSGEIVPNMFVSGDAAKLLWMRHINTLILLHLGCHGVVRKSEVIHDTVSAIVLVASKRKRGRAFCHGSRGGTGGGARSALIRVAVDVGGVVAAALLIGVP